MARTKGAKGKAKKLPKINKYPKNLIQDAEISESNTNSMHDENLPSFSNDATVISSQEHENHQQFISSDTTQSYDDDFISKMGIENEVADKYKYQEEYNSFEGNVKPRGEHANIKTDPSINEVSEFIPPPDQAQPIEQKPFIAPNPEMNDLSAPDKEKAAAAFVDVIFTVWGLIKGFAGSKAGIDIDKVKKLAVEAKIDINAQIPIGPNESVTLMDMVNAFNGQIPNAFIVSETFKNTVRAPMIREFVKRNLGLTDMQLIFTYWGVEFVTAGYNFMDLKKQGNRIISQQQEIFKELQSQKTTASKIVSPPVSDKNTEPVTEQPKVEFKEPEENSDTKK